MKKIVVVLVVKKVVVLLGHEPHLSWKADQADDSL